MTSIKVVAICLGLYAIYLPAAWLVHRDYIPIPQPSGGRVEMLTAFHHDKPDHYVTRSVFVRTTVFPHASRLSVYEDLTLLPKGHVGFTSDLGVYIVRIKTTDDSDPRSNGRRYWLVGSPDD
jgi:hypothetical protein